MLVRFKTDITFVARAGEERELPELDAEWCIAIGAAEVVQQQSVTAPKFADAMRRLQTATEPQQLETR